VKQIETTKEKCLWTIFDALKDWAKEDLGQWSSPGGSYPEEPKNCVPSKAVKKQNITSMGISQIFAEREALILTSGSPFITTLYSYFQNKLYLDFLNILRISRLSLY
jgi:hypothetical protein